MTAPFDLQALYQASQLPLPPDPVQAQQLWAANAADLAAAADEIRRLRGRAEQAEAAWQEMSRPFDTTEYNAMHARTERLEEALRAIHANATAWHGDAAAKGRALNVIAAWALHPESIPEGVREGVRAALAPAEGRVAG